MPAPTQPRRTPTRRRLALTLLLSVSASQPARAVDLRVLVSAGQQITLRTPDPAAPTGVTTWKVAVNGARRGANLTLNGQDAGNTALYLPPSAGRIVEISGRTYRGGVLLRAQDGGVQAINVVNLEDYLRGVVPSEMPASWPGAALQAQAVIARTYAASRVNPALPYDTCATQQCQVYDGIAAEKPNTDAAILSTAGLVIGYGGKAATTYFSSDSGGFTASAKETWNMDLPYLIAKPDPFSNGPRARWTLNIPAAQVQAVAAQYGAKIGTLRDVAATRVSESGRPSELTLTGSAGTFRIQGASAGGFIRALGGPSSRANLSFRDGTLTVQGAGSGHGVGLSQYGALGLANAGYDVLHVLGFYYPGTVLSRLSARSGADGGAVTAAAPGVSALAALTLPLPLRPGVAEHLGLPEWPTTRAPLETELKTAGLPVLTALRPLPPLPFNARLPATGPDEARNP